jgi:hypothetical protein
VRARARAVEHRVKCKSVLRDVANNIPSVTRLEWAGRGVDDDTACAVAYAIKCVRHNFSITFRFPLLFTLISLFAPFNLFDLLFLISLRNVIDRYTFRSSAFLH